MSKELYTLGNSEPGKYVKSFRPNHPAHGIRFAIYDPEPKFITMNKFDKDNFSGENHEGNKANTPLRFLTASSVIGDKVYNHAEERLGTIKDIMLDLSGGKIEYVVVEMGGFLGIGEKYFAIPYPLLKVDPANERFVLNQNKETLMNAPGFDKDHWPETNAHFSTSNEYWGGFMGANTGSEPF